ncbi:hypothetical protein B0T19DRAFT_462792 [Cercophora scortea]|uniref:Uncharacterized protein n=1 Tax=Cercophora scortea TaxID=314031 RepID=A0AAE0IDZ6_9PEZI|nr:hypothetical protein B0T19DRAFT_462792 [Cercophora scortea]
MNPYSSYSGPGRTRSGRNYAQSWQLSTRSYTTGAGSSTRETSPDYSGLSYNDYFDSPFTPRASYTPPSLPGTSYQGLQPSSSGYYSTEQEEPPRRPAWAAINTPRATQQSGSYGSNGSSSSYLRLPAMDLNSPRPLRPPPGQYTGYLGPNPLARSITPHPFQSARSTNMPAYRDDFFFDYGYTNESPARVYRDRIASDYYGYAGMSSGLGRREVWTGGMPSSGRDTHLMPPPPPTFSTR